MVYEQASLWNNGTSLRNRMKICNTGLEAGKISIFVLAQKKDSVINKKKKKRFTLFIVLDGFFPPDIWDNMLYICL